MYEWCPTYCSSESNITVAVSVAWLEYSRNLLSKTAHIMEAFFLYPLRKFESFKNGVIIETTLLINLVIICSSLILDVSTNNVWCIVQMEPHRTWVSLKYEELVTGSWLRLMTTLYYCVITTIKKCIHNIGSYYYNIILLQHPWWAVDKWR